jgi:hypothetical protein
MVCSASLVRPCSCHVTQDQALIQQVKMAISSTINLVMSAASVTLLYEGK